MFDEYIRLWGLISDGSSLLTATSHLLPVLFQGQPAILKVATCEEERRGNAVMAWWNGDGAARVLAHCGDAVVLERARQSPSLVDFSRSGRDEDAIRIACAVGGRLHSHRSPQRPSLVPLGEWFGPLLSLSSPTDSILGLSANAAENLLSGPLVNEVVLHGDIHHGNILHFGERGWLSIDPKGLLGERGFDYANLFCNPGADIAADPIRFSQRIAIVADAAKLDRRRLLQWILAWSGLSALWMVEDGLSAETQLSVAKLAAGELNL